MQKYRGRGQRMTALLEQAIALIAHRQPMTVRGVCYALFVIKAIASMADNETKRISRVLTQAREDGLIPWEWIVDESREMEEQATWRNLGSFARTITNSWRRDYWESQPYNVQVWSEKSTVAGVVRPILEQYGVPFMSVHGFASATSLHNAAQASASDRRATVILYVGDWDPSGMCMSEVDLPDRMQRYGGRVTVRRIALVESDLAGLPSFPAKDKDKRFEWYKQRYGTDAWELDAMDPNELRARVAAAIQTYIEPDAWHRIQLVETAERKTVERMATALAGAN